MPKAARLPNGLTVKEEKFCQEFFASGEAADAYRAVYNVDPAKNGDWVSTEAYKLLQRDYIQKRMESLRKSSESIALYTADSAMAEAREAFDIAKKDRAPSAMVSAVTLRAKLAGHLVEKREVAHKSLKEGSKEELLDLLDKSAKEAGLVIQKAKDESSGR